MHAAKLDKSERLQRVLNILQDRRWHSTRDIVNEADVCAVNSIISELRRNGIAIECECFGKGRYHYRLIAKEKCDYWCPGCQSGDCPLKEENRALKALINDLLEVIDE